MKKITKNPVSKTAKISMWVGIFTISVWVCGALFSLLNNYLFKTDVNNNDLLPILGDILGLLVLLTPFIALSTGLYALIKGERTWRVWISLITAILIYTLLVAIIIWNVMVGD